MKTRVGIVLTALSMLFVVGTVAATPQYFLNQAAFEAAFPALPFDDFSGASVVAGDIEDCGPSVSSGNACFPGGFIHGLTLSPDGNGSIVTLGAGQQGLTSTAVAADLFHEPTVLDFTDDDVHAVGFFLRTTNKSLTIEVQVNGTDGSELGTTTLTVGSNGSFWGVQSNAPIGQIVLDSRAGEILEHIQFGPADLQPVAHVRFDEGSGTSFSYGSGVGTVLGNGIWGLGQQGTSLETGPTEFAAFDDPADGSLDLTDGMTLALWVRPDALGAHQILISKDDAYELELGNLSAGTLNLRLNNYIEGVASTPMQEGVWQHVAVTWDGSLVRFYRNGQPDGTHPCGLSLRSNDAAIGLGGRPGGPFQGGPVYQMDGALDDVRIYDVALSAVEIGALFADTVTDVEPPRRFARVPGSAVSTMGPTSLGLSTDEVATCRYHQGDAGLSYDAMTESFGSGDGLTHGATIAPASTATRYFSRCRDARGNTHQDDYALGIAVGNVDVIADVEAFWSFDEGSGCIAIDASALGGGPAYDGVLGPDCEGGNAPRWIDGAFFEGLQFDGDDEVRASVDPMSDPAGLTVSGWLRHRPTQAFRAILDARDSGTDGYSLYVTHESKLFMRVGGSTLVSPQNVADGTWHHVSGVYDGTSIRLYIDGLEVANTTALESIDVDADVLLGQHFSLDAYGLQGSLDEVTLHSRGLSEEEVLLLYLFSQP